MVVGIFVHVILQTCLRKNITDKADMSAVLEKELGTPNSVSVLVSIYKLSDCLLSQKLIFFEMLFSNLAST